MAYANVPRSIREVPDNFKTQEMCERVAEKYPPLFIYVSDWLKTWEMCNNTVRRQPWALRFVPDHFKTQEMCDDAVRNDPYSLQFVPDWFVTQEQIDMWYNDYYDDGDDHWDGDNKIIEWYKGYKNWKAQKVSIKEEPLPITWHPSRYWDWCMSEDEKKRDRKTVGINMGFFVSDDQI